ncbi:uncharacterized protein BYT42DRAFT_544947 [Radiomyces spectabilis]|uniref:uncharacterized protein n=1 Tax=Radiomyces spectabilis TaxID=64574 RepID=UPI002220AE51|nr:uncharacterized protein BYT42DRAFT_544947 [Radiomyces spectabilis]KAI8380986.1 hypothetical protein BYT42DRAFT_544947 [Radiomyces spectabilis]
MSLNRKRPNSSIVPLYDDDRSIINTVDPDLLIGSLKKEADQFEELLVFQLDKIEQYKKEIIHWIAKLKEMDDAVEILSSNITTIRSEKLMTMKQILNETNKREPFLKKARDQHKKIVRGIEHYSKSNDSGIRLKQLLAKYETAHHREMISARIRYWIFPIGVTWLCLPSS